DLNSLALVLRDLGRPADARPLLERAVTIDETTRGPNHPNLAIDLNNLATVLKDLDRPADARPLLERALTIDENAYGPIHPDVALRLNNLASVLQDLDRLADATALRTRARAIIDRLTARERSGPSAQEQVATGDAGEAGQAQADAQAGEHE
ncbi:tetratricopeptide repeat protein, partial [Paractinoplanes tereljensis]